MMMGAIYLCCYFALSSQRVAERLCLVDDTRALWCCGECGDEQSPRSVAHKGQLCRNSSSPAATGPSQAVGAGLTPAGPSLLPAMPCWAPFGESLPCSLSLSVGPGLFAVQAVLLHPALRGEPGGHL